MNIRTSVVIAMIVLGVTPPARAASSPAVQVKAAKGPVQITLRLYKTKVKTHKTLWYKLELKNIGKEKIRIEDKSFSNPWAMHENSKARHGIYIEIIDSNGKPLEVHWGGDRVKYDWEPKDGETLPFTPGEQKEIDALQSEWKARGLTGQQQSIALSSWVNKLSEKKNMAETLDPAKQLWLRPGASTTTLAWAYRDPEKYADHSTEETQVGDYTQLWSYEFFHPGKYRIRAVYDEDMSPATRGEAVHDGLKLSSWWVKVKTPFIDFQVTP